MFLLDLLAGDQDFCGNGSRILRFQDTCTLDWNNLAFNPQTEGTSGTNMDVRCADLGGLFQYEVENLEDCHGSGLEALLSGKPDVFRNAERALHQLRLKLP